MEFLIGLSANVAYASLDTVIANTNRLIINPLILFIFSVAMVYFLYGLVQLLANQENEEKKTAGKSHMLYGVIGLSVMIGVFMIMKMLLSTFNITGINVDTGAVTLPPYTPTYPGVGTP